MLSEKRVQSGDHGIILQRIEPPVAAAQRPAAAGPDASAEPASGKPEQMLLLSATVYDREVTLLRWTHQGRQYRAWSNLDFHHVAGLGAWETSATRYSLVMTLGDQSREQAEAEQVAARTQGAVPHTPRVPARAEFDPRRAEYRQVPGDPAAPPEALAAVTALHRHFDVHRTALIASYEQRLVEQAEREQQLRENPPARKDTVFRYWRVPSAVKPGAVK